MGRMLFWLRWFIQLGAFWPKKMHFLTIFPFSAKITISLKRSLRPQKLTKCANFLHAEWRDHEEYFIFFALYFVDPQSITKMVMKNIHFRRILLCWCSRLNSIYQPMRSLMPHWRRRDPGVNKIPQRKVIYQIKI